ncbi:MAG: response regulator [Treponema sp.]|jgi:signal transduction histidine kinase/FixJ family two-component response regulator/HPt (histidine-containing phosphotransfer) domain-containing protein|nr:response regulator [Treponema sp.]
MTVKRISSVQTYIYAVSFLVFVTIAFGVIIYFITSAAVKDQLGNRALGTASAVAVILEENPKGFRDFVETLDTGSDYYIRTKKLIEKIRFAYPDNITFITVEVRVSEDEVMYPLIGEKEGTDTYSPPGTVEPFTVTRRRAYDTQSAVKGDFVTTVWGTLMSAYVPMFDNRNGEFMGLVGTDISIDHYYAIMKNYLAVITVSTAMIILMGAVIIRLGKTRIQADRENVGKSEFLSRMSHEIRTPLNVILGLAEIEMRESHSDRTRLNLEKIHRSGSHLLEIVNDILDISKIEFGKFEIVPVEYEFASMVNDTIQLNVTRIGAKRIAFKLDADETIPAKLYGDERRIKQILNNLLSNAFKYTAEGEVRLRIGWERRNDAAWLYFTVEDTGSGIKQADLEKLFSEYTRFDTMVNRRIEGTGLGLSIARGLAEMMGGTITAESEYGKGSIFRVSLPQRIIDAGPIGKERAEKLRDFRFTEDRKENRETVVRSWMPYGRVLVVDDLAANLDVMTGLLTPYGLQVDTASSGREAVERIRKGEPRYDLVFMDHMMPEMDGVEAVRIIRDEIDGEYPLLVPIIMLTANALTGNRELFMERGFSDFISKPIDVRRLDAVLNRWVRDTQSEETLRAAEKQAGERTEGAGQAISGSGLDGEGRWLLDHPVEGADFAAALILYGDSGAALIPILKSFVTHTPPLLEKMNAHLETSLPDYTVEVHGLKGTCGAICADGTAALARELEFASKEGNADFVRSHHEELRRQTLDLTERLKSLLAEWDACRPAQEKEQRTEPDRELLARLSAATAEFNSNLTEEILGELEQYRYERGEELITWLREQAENFDYDAIHRRLEEPYEY